MTSSLSPRRKPAQSRSRKRVDAILGAVVRLVVDKGYAQVSMREVARELSIPISSLYQYFPSKEAIAAALADHYMGELHRLLPGTLARLDLKAPTGELIAAGVGAIVDAYWQYDRAHPELPALWAACQADPALQARDRAQCENQARDLARLMAAHARRPADDPDLLAHARWCVETLGATLRRAITLPENEACALLGVCRQQLVSALTALAQRYNK